MHTHTHQVFRSASICAQLSSIADPRQHAQELEESYGTPSFTKVARPKRKVFARFTALRHLSLLDDDNNTSTANVGGLLPALRGMTQLIFLEVGTSGRMNGHMCTRTASASGIEVCVLRK